MYDHRMLMMFHRRASRAVGFRGIAFLLIVTLLLVSQTSVVLADDVSLSVRPLSPHSGSGKKSFTLPTLIQSVVLEIDGVVASTSAVIAGQPLLLSATVIAGVHVFGLKAYDQPNGTGHLLYEGRAVTNVLGGQAPRLVIPLGHPDSVPGGPTVVSMIPDAGVTNVSPSQTVSATFSESLKASTVTTSTFSLVSSGAVSVSGFVFYDTNTKKAMFAPVSPLAFGTSYTATLTTGITDTLGPDGNPLASAVAWTFTTSSQAGPAVLSTTPADQTLNASESANLTINFSEVMKDATINGDTIVLMGPLGRISGTVSCNSPCTVATFNPTSPLSNSTDYTLTITTGVENLAGEHMVLAVFASFITDSE